MTERRSTVGRSGARPATRGGGRRAGRTPRCIARGAVALIRTAARGGRRGAARGPNGDGPRSGAERARRPGALALPAAAAAILWAFAAPARAGGGTDRARDRVRVDWARGRITAVGAAAADLRAPRPDVARVRAERTARARAAAALAEAARALPWAGGGTVGAAAAAAAEAQRRLAAALARARDGAIDYGSDGSVVVELVAPIEAIRTALQGPGEPPAAAGPSAVVVDARRALRRPAVGLALRAGGRDYRGPMVFYRSLARALADPRRGPDVARTVASRADGGALIVDGADDRLVAGAPLVIVVVGR
ncbi:MAG: hypothetical protein D6689_13085 [Deltaproteobacteria bacterium]|nr:MAG: hypothetical protein D6689_13085 [Deltaproteobacteria bacterium]